MTKPPTPARVRAQGEFAAGRRRVGVFIVSGVITGVTAMFALMITVAALHHQGQISHRMLRRVLIVAVPVSLGLVVIAPLIGMVRLAIINKRNTRRLGEIAAAEGFTAFDKPTAEEKPSLFAGLEAIDKLRKGSAGVTRAFTGSVDGRDVRVLRHTHVVWAGNHAQRVTYWVAAAEAPLGWPAVYLWRSATPTLVKFFRKLSPFRSIVGEAPDLENKQFNERWSLRTASREFADLALTPEAQQFLVDSPAGESWHIGGGVVALLRKDELDADLFREFARRPVELLGMIPPELEAWTEA